MWRMPAPARLVRNWPGSTISTLTPNGAISCASASDAPSSANFVAEYALKPANDSCPPRLDMLTIAPPRCPRSTGSAARVTAIAPKKLVSKIARSSASGVSSSAPTTP